MKYNKQKTKYKRAIVGFYKELEFCKKQAKKEGLSFSAFIRQCINYYATNK